ncbi:MAG: tRNA (uridine(34)/cytosine(34)/5-carboxymethylaminomethyluridine(34)-2'-O)-methyltransferase TrmL, partial [Oscillospiraceae bacterium]|nr:tRNA (uridine(34)/cytosine(34)/5-carboxymethylaminomethyluridine(34)-2'-O)-methyltransferase TrmL [Oscillospiraceae bacterium]
MQIVLHQPEIPQNTGNIVRTCSATGTLLRLIKPLGFSTGDRQLKRAGLDYWETVDIRYHDSFEDFLCSIQKPRL